MIRVVMRSWRYQEPGQKVNGNNFMAKNHKGHWRSCYRPGCIKVEIFGNPSHSPIGKHFPNSKYENVKNKQIQISIFAPAGTKILDLFGSEHPHLESRKSLLREFTQKSDFILMATDVSAFL